MIRYRNMRVLRASRVLMMLWFSGCTAPSKPPAKAPARASAALVIAGLSDKVRVAFDDLGTPSIEAATRDDALRGLGYVTARDRLAQMDLLRRRMAGRLAEVLGRALLEADVQQRRYGFERTAQAILTHLPAEQRAALAAYADGVNAYLTAGLRPLELELLGYSAEPWRPEDSLLLVLAMFQDLGDSEQLERTRSVLARCVPEGVSSFLLSDVDRYTRALLGEQAPAQPPLPRNELRGLLSQAAGPHEKIALAARAGEAPVGSNAWAVSGRKTRDGRAIVANDMHLDLGVPAIWYRARLRYGETELTGLVLPGVPTVVVGSNRHVAWALTNLEADVMDLVPLEEDPAHPTRYRTPDGFAEYELVEERIAVRGEADVQVTLRFSRFGPVAAEPLLGTPVAVRWAALDPEAVDLGLLALDRAQTVEELVEIVQRAGGPANNVIAADARGRIGWTITGRIPRRRGFDGSRSVSWTTPAGARWDGYLAPAELPRALDPKAGILFNANQRVVQRGAVIGHDFAHGYRASRIRERLHAAAELSEADLFALQLDTRSEPFEFYRALALSELTEANTHERPMLVEARRAIASWDGHAELESTGLALLRRFRRVLAEELFGVLLAPCRAIAPQLALNLPDIDTPLERLLEARPADLVPPPAESWGAFVVAALERATKELEAKFAGRPLAALRWGELNRVRMRHPLSAALGDQRALLDMPSEPLAGCGFCVRMADATLGASERLVVSPGHEADGILHIPAGQSGDPRSPHYRDQQSAWVRGLPLPFLPGTARENLTFVPPAR